MSYRLGLRACVLAAVLSACVAAIASGPSTDAPDPRPAPTRADRVADALAVREASVLRIELPDEPADAFTTTIAIDGAPATLSLHRHSVRAERFDLRYQMPDGSLVSVDPGPVTTYRGALADEPGSRVAANLTDVGLEAVVRRADGTELWIEPLAVHAGLAHDFSEHALYRRTDMLEQPATCAALPGGENACAGHDDDDRSGQRGGGCGGDICLAEIACDADYEFFLLHGAQTSNRIESIINTANMQYEAEVGITHDISTIIVRTSAADPYNATVVTSLWGELRAEWLANQTDVQYDLVQLFTGKDLDGNVVGFAPEGTVCSTSAFSVVQHRSDFARATDLTAHELGHSWNADHCTCPSNTMNPTITGANTFSPTETIPEITAFRDSISCIEPREYVFRSLPFFDDFSLSPPDPGRWPGVEGAVTSTAGLNEPSAPSSLNLSGTSVVRSARIDTTLFTSIRLRYYWQRGGGLDRPDAGEDLIVEFQNAQNQWIEINRHIGAATPTSTFALADITLPNDARHTEFRLRLRNTSPSPNFDHYFVDNLEITGVLGMPGPFNLLTPADGAAAVSAAPLFDWTPAANALTYLVEVDDDPDFSSPITTKSTSASQWQYQGPTLAPFTEHFWRVTASNQSGDTPSTPAAASFATDGPPPQSFVLASPAPDTTIDTTTPTFQWTQSVNASSFSLQVDDDPAFNSPEIDVDGLTFPQGGSLASYTAPDGALQDNTTYAWRMTATNPAGSVDGIPQPMNFTIETTPPPTPCEGDADGNNVVDVNDIRYIVQRLGDTTGEPMTGGDADGNAVVDVNDIRYVIQRLGNTCP